MASNYYDRTVLNNRKRIIASSEMKLAGATIEYNGSDQNIYEPVISSGLTVNVVSDTCIHSQCQKNEPKLGYPLDGLVPACLTPAHLIRCKTV